MIRSRHVLAGGMLLGAAWLLLSNKKKRVVRKHEEQLLDKSLKETFPASDATATQDYAIPANRL